MGRSISLSCPVRWSVVKKKRKNRSIPLKFLNLTCLGQRTILFSMAPDTAQPTTGHIDADGSPPAPFCLMMPPVMGSMDIDCGKARVLMVVGGH